MMHPVFLMGNKRSGSSCTVRVLNCHPHAWIAHEADIVWILHELAAGRVPACYPDDGALGLTATLEACADILGGLERPLSKGCVRSLFEQVLTRLRQTGSRFQTASCKADLRCIGDKKPVQHADPRLRWFVREHFPDARYLHIVRHPAAVVGSMMRAARQWQTGVPSFWHGPAEELYARWVMHERWVLDAKACGLLPVHTVQLENLIVSPRQTMLALFDYLDLEPRGPWLDHATGLLRREINAPYRSLQAPARGDLKSIMDLYGYGPCP